MKRSTAFLITILLLASCANKTSIKSKTILFNPDSRIGLILIVDKIENHEEASWNSGVDEFLLTLDRFNSYSNYTHYHPIPTDKYKDALKVVGEELNTKERIRELYTDVFISKGKRIILVDEELDSMTLKDFESPKIKGKYFCKDLRYLREKYQIDEALIVVTRYGLYTKYNSATSRTVMAREVNNHAVTIIDSEFIDLTDNSIRFKNKTVVRVPAKGKQKRNLHFDEVENLVKKSLEDALATEKVKYQ